MKELIDALKKNGYSGEEELQKKEIKAKDYPYKT